jgi:hypothetical protein
VFGDMAKKILFLIIILVASLLLVKTAYAINDITIDGALGDWGDEVGFYLDPYGDATPARTDITQFGLAVVNNDPAPESLALMMGTDDYLRTGNRFGDSHQMVFYVGPYTIIVQIQNGCDAVNWVTVTPSSTTDYTAVAVATVSPPVYASPPQNDSTPDCAMEIEFPISALPLLDTDLDGKLLDENFNTYYYTRQSGGVGNDNDTGIGLSPSVVTLQSFSVRTDFETNHANAFLVGSGLVFAAILIGARSYLSRRRLA